VTCHSLRLTPRIGGQHCAESESTPNVGGIDLQKRLNIKVVSSQDDLKEHFLVNCDEFLVPFGDISGPLAGLIVTLRIARWKWLATVVLAVLQDLRNIRQISKECWK